MAKKEITLAYGTSVSLYQIGTLDWIATREVTLNMVGQLNMNTLGSILNPKRGYVYRDGEKLKLTEMGQKVRQAVRNPEPNMRDDTSLPLSPRVSHLLGMRNLRSIKTA